MKIILKPSGVLQIGKHRAFIGPIQKHLDVCAVLQAYGAEPDSQDNLIYKGRLTAEMILQLVAGQESIIES